MTDALLLTLVTQPAYPLVADCVAPDRLASLGASGVAELPVSHGGRPARLGDFFRVTGPPSATLRIEGDLEKVEGLGTAMAGGELVIEGNVGRDLGLEMAGGRIDLRGSAADNAGGAGPGASRGMTGGEIVIRGNAGNDVGARLRRGIIVVTGDAKGAAARGAIAGTVVVFGRAGPGAGRFMKRGSIVAFGPVERPATFRYACTYRPPYVSLLLRYLRAQYGLPVTDAQIGGRYERHSGDLAELGKGEILQWVAE